MGAPPWPYQPPGPGRGPGRRRGAGGPALTVTTGASAKTEGYRRRYNALPGIRRTRRPGPPEYRFLADRLEPLGLTTLSGHNGLTLHFHVHADIFVNGKKVKIRRSSESTPGRGIYTELHTHDDSGVIHIEAQKSRDFTLGQFFAEWAVLLNANHIGGYSGLKWYLDGKLQTGNPQTLVFKPHQELAFVVGKPPAKIPSSYTFPAGE